MIRVTVELVPRGDETRKRHLGTAIIANDVSGTLDSGNYKVWLSKWGKPEPHRLVSHAWKTGRVEEFPRVKLGPWDLLYRALANTVGSRNVLPQ